MKRLASTAATSLLLAACASGPPPERPPADFAAVAALDASEFPGAANVLSGFAPRDEDSAMRVGDAALLGVTFADGERIEHLLLLLEVIDLVVVEVQRDGATVQTRPWYNATTTVRTYDKERGLESTTERTSIVHPVRFALTRHDAAGNAQQASTAMLFEEALAAGFWPDTDAEAPEEARDLAGVLTRTLQGLVDEDDVLQNLMFRIVDPPSLWSIATNLGVGVALVHRAERDKPEAVELPDTNEPLRRLPIDIWVNDKVALWVDLVVAQPNGATRTCGGLVGALARHPTEPGRTATVRLLATRRGAPATVAP